MLDLVDVLSFKAQVDVADLDGHGLTEDVVKRNHQVCLADAAFS
jgi:hypothetical protein